MSQDLKQLIEDNLGLAYRQALKLWNSSYRIRKRFNSIEDLKQEAVIGMATQIHKCDFSNPKWPSFLSYCVLCYLKRESLDHSFPIRVPRYTYHEKRSDQETTPLSKELRAHAMRTIGRECSSHGLGDIPSREKEEFPLGHKDSLLREALSRLDPRRKSAVSLYYGLDGEALTLEAIGKRLGGVSRERARQLVGDAMNRLKELLNAYPCSSESAS